MKRIDIDAPEIDMDGSQRLLYRGEPFTGEVVEHLGDALVSLESFRNGVPHGPNREWYEDGTLRSEGQARDGRAVGVTREWHKNGTLAVEKVIAEDGLTLLSHQHWDENGQSMRIWRGAGRDGRQNKVMPSVRSHASTREQGEQ